MSAQPESNAPAYRPPGYCPQCAYPTDVGTCPECSFDIPPGKLQRHALSYRRRRLFKRLGLVFLILAMLAGGYTYYRSAHWTTWLPNGWVLGLANLGHEPSLIATRERLIAGDFSNSELHWLVANLFNPSPDELKHSVPRDYPLRIGAVVSLPFGFDSIYVHCIDAKLFVKGVERDAVPGLELHGWGFTNVIEQPSPIVLPPGAHALELRYRIELQHNPNLVAAAKIISPPLPITLPLKVLIDERRLADLVALVPDTSGHFTAIRAKEPEVTFFENRLYLRIAELPAEHLALEFAVRCPGDETFVSTGRVLLIGDQVTFSPRTYADNASGHRTGFYIGQGAPRQVEARITLSDDLGRKLQATDSFELKLISHEFESRVIAFEHGQEQAITGQVILPGVVVPGE